MTRQTHLRAEFVEFIPDRLEPGKLYISRRFSTAVHLCCCGCGHEVVTPLNSARWQLTESNGKITLYPSIGNWNFPCQSHYWITENHIQWAGAMSPKMIATVREQDRQDAAFIYAQPAKGFRAIRQYVVSIWAKVIRRTRK